MTQNVESVSLPVEGGWQAIEDVRFEHMWDAKEVCHQDIHVDVTTTQAYQTIAGIGGSFSELGQKALESLDEQARGQVARKLFSPDEANLNFCRIPIGSSDFATDAYSCNDTPDDFEMKHFNLDRDEQCMLKYIHLAQQANPALKFHASAWSPPGWLKTTGTMTGGGQLIDDPKVYKAYALYLRMFCEAYGRRGVPISRLLIQNEPECGKSYPTCSMPWRQMVTFTVDYLAPELARAGLDTEIWAGTHTRLAGLYPIRCLADERFAATVKGLGFQYELPEKIRDLTQARPGLGVMHTESNCYMGLNQVVEGVALFEDIWDFMTANSDNFTYWNTILPEPRKSGWGWCQNSLVVVDPESKQVTYTPDYEVMKILAANAVPGSLRLPVHCLHLRRIVAFRKPNGSVVVLLYNPADAKKARFTIDEVDAGEVEIPTKSLIAVTLTK